MARKPRLFVPGATYHVYCRVARGEFVFDDPYEAEEFVEKVREIRDGDDWRSLAWCLIGNNYHLVIKIGSILNKHPSSTTRWLNKGVSLELKD